MIKFYNTKMMSPLDEEPSGDPVMPGKGTYAYDKIKIEAVKADFPEEPDPTLITAITENAITYFENDHPVETEEPDAEKQIIYNHDYILQVDPSETAMVRESKDILDASIRADVAQSIGQLEDIVVGSISDGDDPVVDPAQ